MKNGKGYSFASGAFGDPSPERTDRCLDEMLEIKRLFAPDSITILGAENVDAVAEQDNFNESQKEKLTELFS